MTVVPAHVGHWLADIMYVLPVLVVAIRIGVRALLDRRADKAAGPGDSSGPAGDPPV